MIIDPRFHQLAAGLTGFSTELKKGERVRLQTPGGGGYGALQS